MTQAFAGGSGSECKLLLLCLHSQAARLHSHVPSTDLLLQLFQPGIDPNAWQSVQQVQALRYGLDNLQQKQTQVLRTAWGSSAVPLLFSISRTI